MMSVQFSETNLAQIPEDLYLRWHFLAMVVFEKGLLTSLPYEMFFLPTYKMSFAGNRIETIPALAMMPPGMIYAELVLKDNPLKELPAQLTDPTAFILSLNVENTSEHDTGMGEDPNDGRVDVRHAVLRCADDRPRTRVQGAMRPTPRSTGIQFPNVLVRGALPV
ncbi:hypothetical protein PR003_g411 [Phytophthora rubi]|uniref:Uncharacterized protein n=1 Tax=Phytophthora rubi TaxID=129364 RepID=A0A6A4G745_9STRA|nr:hypothetical protein PR002_g1985 [Phytophthora rubi]KAE9360095.1 hypothetical protein PR003_g411 [Phytophthora rubi]